jgi:hypothetical protein
MLSSVLLKTVNESRLAASTRTSSFGKQKLVSAFLISSAARNMAYGVQFSADGNELTSGGRTRWDLRTGSGLRIVPDTGEKTYGIPTPDGRLVVVRKGNTNLITVIESPSGKQLFTLTPSGDAGPVSQTSFSADGTMLAVVL